jgi:ABC-type Zn uptake system ZnuABC Zn-binding protein ZnuA
MVKNAVRALSGLDPANAALYEKNGKKIQSELRTLAEEFRSAGLAGRKIAVQHDIYAYLARLCGMEMEVSLRAEESQSLSPARIAKLCREIREKKVTVLYAEPQYSKETAELIAREAGIAYSVLDPCASGPADPEPGYYQKVMRRNLETLRGGNGK